MVAECHVTTWVCIFYTVFLYQLTNYDYFIVVNKQRSSSAGRSRDSEAEDKPDFNPRFEAANISSKLAYQGEHGERRKLGLSVGAGLHSCA